MYTNYGGNQVRKTVVRSFSIPPKLLKELERTAEEESRTYSELVREAIRQYLKNKHIDEIQMASMMRGRPAPRPQPDLDEEDDVVVERPKRKTVTAVKTRSRR